MMKIQVFQHVAFEDIGSIKDWATANNHEIAYTRFYNGDKLPQINSFDFLVVMGGPMGVDDTDQYNWLATELRFIKEAINANKYVLGICLGSQFIAKALDANVYSSGKKEIGWFDVTLSDAAKEFELFKNCENQYEVFHWHGDTFDLPKGAKLLMSSEAFQNQGFIYSDNVLAFQFHIEVKLENVLELVENCGDELLPDIFVQNEAAILDNTYNYERNNSLLSRMLDIFVG